MTLDEKINNFYHLAIDSATIQSIEIIKEYQETLNKIYQDRKDDALRKADIVYRMESDQILRNKNRMLSHETLNIKRKVLERTTELTDLLFLDITKKLYDYMKTSEYDELLAKQIRTCLEYAQMDEIIVYINSTDSHRKEALESRLGIQLVISDRDFVGGIRAVISSRSILIDNSFLTKLEEAKNNFSL